MKKYTVRFMTCCLLAFTLIFGLVPVQSVILAQSDQKFKDVPKTFWASGAINALSDKGFVGGYTDGTFRPNKTISRAEFTTMLVKISELTNAKQNPYKDVTGGWALHPVNVAYAAGLIPTSDFGNEFKPNQNITRYEIARMISKAMIKDQSYKEFFDIFSKLNNSDLPLTDSKSIQRGQIQYVALTLGTGIMSGYNDQSIGLRNNATRAEAVAMLTSYYNSRSKKPEDYQYLKELKELAETGTNVKTVSKSVPMINIVDGKLFDFRTEKWINSKLTLTHPNYTVKLKRMYLLPYNKNKKSLYEDKFIGKDKVIRKDYSGIIVVVTDMTFNKDGGRLLFMQNLSLRNPARITSSHPYEKFGIIHQYVSHHDYDFILKKGETKEITFYGYFDEETFDTMDITGPYQNYILLRDSSR
ncbi:S-layer homology domain-containing protein [Paenibacillus abyssi]|uniref:SLH domain-containing protein n=1 Tax=Paenibacillus abyssi TaxID=1340531 RepID=A0A917D426_9BACL|nr:S-layer homology domain-containing protein [Paenibacillus abyssi]GGG09351.1 hypothetical protein GCM10010916_27750 [Paenibacillus abyssi]